MQKKFTVAVIFGGRSGEHEVSLVSARNVISAFDPTKYSAFPIGITKQGQWLTGKNAVYDFTNGRHQNLNPVAVLPCKKGFMFHELMRGRWKAVHCDIAFPVLHGPYGEDGTIQGLFEMANIPYVGCGVTGSAAAMDKYITKMIASNSLVPTADYIQISKQQFKQENAIIREIAKKISFPCFVKPANLGSSVGISKAKNDKDLAKNLRIAFEFDKSVIVEKAVFAREIECAVIGNENPRASICGEIIPCNEFYDYNAKYVDNASELIIPARISAQQRKQIQEISVKMFKALQCSGMARMDFLLDKNTGEIFFNEANTIPGFTSISMYPRLWAESGLPYKKMISELIRLGMQKYKEKQNLRISPKLHNAWYKENR